MILTTIWERYFLKEALKTFTFFLFGFYGLYSLIDYSTHASSFKHYHFSILDIVKFYAFELITRMDVLIPFAILIASVRTLCTLNTYNELVALNASGISMKRILFPFIAFGIFFTLVCYLGAEYLQPMASKYNTQLDHSRAKAKQKKHAPIQTIYLDDGSILLFQSYDLATKSFYDTFWVRSINDITRIKYLHPFKDPPLGIQVEHFQRNEDGLLVPKELVLTLAMKDMQINKEKLIENAITTETLSLSELKKQIPKQSALELNEKEARLLTTFYYKWAMPWLCLLAVIAPAPFCIRFNRTFRIFFIYALSIFGLVFFYLIMDAAVILGERQMLYPALAIWAPFITFFGFFGWRFLRV